VTEYVETRKFPAAGVSVDYELDLRTTNKLQVDIRKRNLQRMGYYVRLVADEDQMMHGSSMIPIIVYSLYKHKKPDDRKFYPLPTGRISS
jgi:hypothetical protein